MSLTTIPSPRKCPFLQGKNCIKKPETETNKSCNKEPKGQFIRCKLYSDEYYRLLLPYPMVCPLFNDKQTECMATNAKCGPPEAEIQYIGGYRNCDVFSRWFWSLWTHVIIKKAQASEKP